MTIQVDPGLCLSILRLVVHNRLVNKNAAPPDKAIPENEIIDTQVRYPDTYFTLNPTSINIACGLSLI